MRNNCLKNIGEKPDQNFYRQITYLIQIIFNSDKLLSVASIKILSSEFVPLKNKYLSFSHKQHSHNKIKNTKIILKTFTSYLIVRKSI